MKYINLSKKLVLALNEAGVDTSATRFIKTCHNDSCSCASHPIGYDEWTLGRAGDVFIGKHAEYFHGSPSSHQSWWLIGEN